MPARTTSARMPGGALPPTYATAGPPLVPTPAAVDPSREYLAGGSQGYGYFTGAHVLTRAIDDVSRAFGPELYEFMLLDAAVAGSMQKIATGVLSGRVHAIPTVKKVAGRPTTLEQERSEEICENNRQNLNRLARPIEDVLKEMINALAFGNICAELVQERELIDGKKALKSISPKPWWAWRFGVDAAGNVLGVIPTQGALGLAAIGNPPPGQMAEMPDPEATVLGIGPLLDPRHFAILSWDARGGNPQGNSLLRPCYPWWNEKRQAIPDYRKFIRRVAAPKPIAMVDEPGQMVPTVDEHTLLELPGQVEPIMVAVLKLMRRWDNDSAVVLPGAQGGQGGVRLEWWKAENDGRAFQLFYDFCDRAIQHAILQSARAVMEAEHGSKADAKVAQEGTGSLFRFIGGWLARWLRRIFFNLNVENYGYTAAALYTPEFMIGESEAQDIPKTATAFAAIGYTVDPSQLPAMDAILNLPERELEELKPGETDEGEEDDVARATSSGGGTPAKDTETKTRPKTVRDATSMS